MVVAIRDIRLLTRRKPATAPTTQRKPQQGRLVVISTSRPAAAIVRGSRPDGGTAA
jgi:hypothetical protein